MPSSSAKDYVVIRYGILGFNVPLDTVLVISETGYVVIRDVRCEFFKHVLLF